MKKLSMLFVGMILMLGLSTVSKAQVPMVNVASNIPVTNSNSCWPVQPGYGINYVTSSGTCAAPQNTVVGNTGYTSFTVTVSNLPAGITLQIILVDVHSGSGTGLVTCLISAPANSCSGTFSSSAITAGDFLELTFNLPLPQNSSGATALVPTAIWAVQ